MKKTVTIFILLIALLLSSCNVIDNIDQAVTTSSAIDSTESDGVIEKNAHLYAEYLSFERCINSSTDILKGECINIIETSDTIEYEFSVIKKFLGDEVDSNIFVYVEKNQSVSVNADTVVKYEISDLATQTPYQIGSEYYLILTKYVSVYYDHDRYISFISTPFIPADKISESKMYGESILKHSEIKDLETEEDFLNYLSKCIDSIDNTDKPSYHGKPYTTATDMETVIKEADHVVTVKIEAQLFDENSIGNKNIYLCTTIDSLYGEIQKGEKIYVTFFPNTVSVGEEYILALDDSITTITPKHYNFSSKNSLFDLYEYNSITEIIKRS